MSNDPCGTVVALEPELALVDFEMPVGQTGIVFVAALEARLMSWGPSFSAVATQAAYRRAASTLAHTGLVSGATFAFMRHGAEMTVAAMATFLGVSPATIEAWEAETLVVPTNLWYLLADKICAMDGREFCPYGTLPTPDFRPRRIRIYPDIPRLQPRAPSSSCPC